MKLKNEQLYGAFMAMQKVTPQVLPVKVSFALAKLFKELKPKVEAIDEVKTKIIKEYGKEDAGKGWSIPVTDSKYPECMAKLNELFGIEVDFNFDVVKLPLDGLNVSAIDIMLLDPLVIIEEPKNEK